MLKLKKGSAALLLCLLVALFGALGISAAADGENDTTLGSLSSEGSLANTDSSTVTVGEGDDAANYDLNTVRTEEDGDVLGAIDYTDRCCNDKRNHYKIKRIDYIAEYAVVFIRI